MHQFLQARAEQIPNAATETLEPDLADAVAAIRKRHDFLEFGAPDDSAGAQTIPAEEKRSVLETLRSLPGHA